MRTYELVVVVKSDLSADKRKELLETVKKWLDGVKVVKEEEWGQKQLAYPIRHETTGYYLVYSLESEKGMPSDLEKRILAQENILRHLLVRKK